MPKKSPQQLNPLTPTTTPRNKQGQIIDKNNKAVGSKAARFYDPLDGDPKIRRYAELEEIINEFRVRGRLWAEPEEDPEVQKTLDEFDELQKEIHPQISNPLSFHHETWEDEDEEQAPDEES